MTDPVGAAPIRTRVYEADVVDEYVDDLHRQLDALTAELDHLRTAASGYIGDRRTVPSEAASRRAANAVVADAAARRDALIRSIVADHTSLMDQLRRDTAHVIDEARQAAAAATPAIGHEADAAVRSVREGASSLVGEAEVRARGVVADAAAEASRLLAAARAQVQVMLDSARDEARRITAETDAVLADGRRPAAPPTVKSGNGTPVNGDRDPTIDVREWRRGAAEAEPSISAAASMTHASSGAAARTTAVGRVPSPADRAWAPPTDEPAQGVPAPTPPSSIDTAQRPADALRTLPPPTGAPVLPWTPDAPQKGRRRLRSRR